MLLLAAVILGLPGGAAAGPTFGAPQYQEPPDNAFTHYERAFSLLPEGGAWDSTVTDLDAVSPNDAEAIVEGAREALEELRRGLGKPCVMPTVESFEAPMPYLARCRSLVRLLILEGWLRAQLGDSPGAFQSHLDALILGQDVARNGSLVHQFVSLACQELTCRRLRTIVRSGEAKPEALAALLDGLAAMADRGVPLSETLARECAQCCRALEQFSERADGAAAFRRVFGMDLKPGMIPAMLARLERIGPQLVADTKLDYSAAAAREYLSVPEDPLLTEIVSATRRASVGVARREASRRGTVLVAALELYRARHGHYPQRLAELVPEELEALPKDPFGGREFRYALTGPPAYRLYSVGPNLMDEGGMAPAGTEGEDGDLVFSEPE